MEYDLLPSNATPFERAASLAMDEADRLSPGISAMRTAKLATIPDSFLPFLLYEYGLGEVSPFVADKRDLIVSGRDWQRVRGTPEALALALDWLSLTAALDEAPSRRARWNLFMLGLGRIPETDAELDRVEGVAVLSVPIRSHFWRGFRGYDVRPLEWSRKRWGRAAWASSSGVRLRPGRAKWSFGVAYDFLTPVGPGPLQELGSWIPPAGGTLGWIPSAWENLGETGWSDIDEQARIRAIILGLSGRPIHAVLRRSDGSVIGYRRARVARPVSPASVGPYEVAGSRVKVDAEFPSGLYVEIMTGFGDGAGDTVASVSLVWDASPSDPETPGALWVGPEQMTGGIEVLPNPVAIKLRETVRQRLRFLLTF